MKLLQTQSKGFGLRFFYVNKFGDILENHYFCTIIE